MLSFVGRLLSLYESSGLQRILRASGLLKVFGKLANIEALTPRAEKPFFFQQIGQIFPAEGKQRFRVAFHAGCIANVAFARLNEATIRVLQKNGCEVVTPERQTCCGALHLHSGREHEAQALARANVDEFTSGGYDAIITNAAGCGSTLKEYGELLQHDPAYADRARLFSNRVKDVTEFLAGIDLIRDMGPLRLAATYQDSCHLAHGQKIKSAPRKILNAIPGLKLIEMPMADLCCGSAGIYNVVHNDLAMRILEHKMQHANATSASVIATANPGCMLQLSAGARLYGSGQRVAHVVELLDEAYRNYRDAS
jgi:glycolate oxidase iron-sulfur subunit